MAIQIFHCGQTDKMTDRQVFKEMYVHVQDGHWTGHRLEISIN